MEGDSSKSEEQVKNLCDRFMKLLKPDKGGQENGSTHKVLSAPIQLTQHIASSTTADDLSEESIWIQKSESTLQVDSKKLEKAEQQLQKKQARQQQGGGGGAANGNPGNRYKTNEATATQVINKKDARAEASGNNNSKDIRIENFDISFGEKVLLKSAELSLVYGRRYGMVGRNGLGKSTLLKMVSSGQLIIQSHISVLHVEQEVTGDDTLALQSVLESDEKREGLLREEKEINAQMAEGTAPATASTRLAEVYAELEAMESA